MNEMDTTKVVSRDIYDRLRDVRTISAEMRSLIDRLERMRRADNRSLIGELILFPDNAGTPMPDGMIGVPMGIRGEGQLHCFALSKREARQLALALLNAAGLD